MPRSLFVSLAISLGFLLSACGYNPQPFLAAYQNTPSCTAGTSQLAALNGTTVTLGPCAHVVMMAAIDRCNARALRANDIDSVLERAAQGGLATAAAATAIGGAAGATGGTLAAIGVGTAILTNVSNGIPKILPTTPYATSAVTMDQAAAQYASLNPSATDERSYAGLWNAVGLACSPDLFKAAVDVESLSLPIATPAPPVNIAPATPPPTAVPAAPPPPRQ